MFPLISIIIPVFNCERYISKAIESCFRQTYPNIEIIIIDDGSTDQTKEIIYQHGDCRIKLYSLNRVGQTRATNFGISKSNGEFIQYLDADDYLSYDKISNQYNLIHKEKETIVYCKWASVIDNQIYINDQNRLFKQQDKTEWFHNQFYHGEMLANSSYLIPRSVIKKAGLYDENLNYNNDFDYFNRTVFCSANVVFDCKSLCFYRRNVTDSITSKFSLDDAISEINAKKKVINYFIFNEELSYKNDFSVLIGSLYYKLATYQYFNLIDMYDPLFKNLGLKPKLPCGENIFNKISYLIGLRNSLEIKKYVKKLNSVIFLKYSYFKTLLII